MNRPSKIFEDREAERAVIGSVLIDNSCLPLLASKLKSSDFYDMVNAKIWSAIMDLYDKKEVIDLVTLSDYSGKLSASPYLMECMNSVPTALHAESYADRIINQSRLRSFVQLAGRISAIAYEEKQHEDAIDRIQSVVLEATDTPRDSRLISPKKQAILLKELFEAKSQGSGGIPSGYNSLDSLTGGLHRGDLIVVAGRTSTGKSTFAENLAERVAKNGHPVLFVSLEMSPEQLLHRFAVREGTLSMAAIQYGPSHESDYAKIEGLASQRSGLPMYLLDMPGATPMAVRSAVHRVIAERGQLDLVVVDYLQIMGSTYSDKEHLRIGEITKSLKQLAREFKVTVVLLSQLNRNIELRGGEPKLADLRDSGKIEEDSDIVILLWRADKEDALGNSTFLKVEKNRNGPLGRLDIKFNPSSFLFTERD